MSIAVASQRLHHPRPFHMHHVLRTTHLELSAVLNDNLGLGGSRLRADTLASADNIHALDDRAKDAVLAVQPRGLGGADEELGAVGVGSSVGHRKDSRSSVLELKVLVSELVSID